MLHGGSDCRNLTLIMHGVDQVFIIHVMKRKDSFNTIYRIKGADWYQNLTNERPYNYI
jgi:hypothetical protein